MWKVVMTRLPPQANSVEIVAELVINGWLLDGRIIERA